MQVFCINLDSAEVRWQRTSQAVSDTLPTATLHRIRGVNGKALDPLDRSIRLTHRRHRGPLPPAARGSVSGDG